MKFLLLTLTATSLAIASKNCTYSYSVWNVPSKRSLNRLDVKKPYKSLTRKEKGEFGCSLCEEDQETVKLLNGVQFKICKNISTNIVKTLNESISKGFKITSVLGYNPQMSRGEIDSFGNRTVFSNHSYGTAIDINRENNGLYTNCVYWSSDCRLLHGGIYNPSDPKSLNEKSFLVQKFLKLGFKWGGTIKGKQKDFMHFSKTGY